MTYAEYINWIIEHPENFTFIRTILCPDPLKRTCYLIMYTSPALGSVSRVASFSTGGDIVTDLTIRQEVANTKDIYIDKLIELCKSEKS